MPILVEIVSAQLDMEGVGGGRRVYNTFCVVKDLVNGEVTCEPDSSPTASSLRISPKQIHQTKVVKKSNNPIWTVLTDSLFIVEIPSDNERNLSEGKIQIDLYHKDLLKLNDKWLGSVFLRKRLLLQGDGTRTEFALGSKTDKGSNDHQIAAGSGKRHGGGIRGKKLLGAVGGVFFHHNQKSENSMGIIALRYRKAESHELIFMQKRESSGNALVPFFAFPLKVFTVKSNIFAKSSDTTDKERVKDDLLSISKHKPNPLSAILPVGRGIKQVQNIRAGVVGHHKAQGLKYEVKPYPDPENPRNTSWLTKDEICHLALEPSRKWIQVDGASSSHTTIGTLNVEIIQCRHLPNLDSGALGDVTDSFVGMIFENAMVQTDVIYDELSPRFMPWCQRAFAFSIQHPASLLFIGVFDSDNIGDHIPIGRVVLDLSSFKCNTTYLLRYKLFSNPKMQDKRGEITLRLRVDWLSERTAMMKTFSAPPHFRVNVPNHKDFRMIRYLCRGQLDMEQATVATVKEYAHELLDYVNACYTFVDVVARTLLWRGRMQLTFRKSKSLKDGTAQGKPLKLDLWFPYKSAFVFLSVMCAIENPHLIPALLFYTIALIMWATSYNYSNHPSPWKRCESVPSIFKKLINRQDFVHIDVVPYQGYEASLSGDELEKARRERVQKLLFALKSVAARVSKEKKKGDPYYYLVATEDKNPFKLNLFNFLDSPLQSIHLILKNLCSNLRILRSIITWKAYHYSFAIMVYSILIGTAFVLLPVNKLIQWVCRIVALVILGPWMKLVDIFYIMPYFPAPDRETDTLEVKEPNVEAFFESSTFKMLTKRVRIAQEEALKLKDMREYLFGRYMEAVPTFDESRYPNIPEPSSSAHTYRERDGSHCTKFGYEYLPKSETKWVKIHDQKLEGDMLPHIVSTLTEKQKAS